VTPDIIVTHGTVIAISHCHCHVVWCQFDTWQLFKNFKKF